MTEPTPCLRVGTLNTRTLSGKVGAVTSAAGLAGVNVLALQETRLPSDSTKAVWSAFRHAGWRFFLGPQGTDRRGATTAGVAFIADVPAEPVDLPEKMGNEGRVMCIKVARDGARPLLVLNLYLPAWDRVPGNEMALQAIAWARSTAEDFVILGDWNRPEEAYPVGGLVARGVVWSMDGDYTTRGGTFRRQGELSTHIDFGVSSPRLLVDARRQWLGVADHDLVCYDLRARPVRDDRRWQPHRRLKLAEPLDWAGTWAGWAPAFRSALAAHDLDEAWRCLSGAAEEAMAEADARGVPRSAWGKPSVQEPHHCKCRDYQTLLERRLRRVARRAAASQTGGDYRLAQKLRTNVQELAVTFPELRGNLTKATLTSTLLSLAEREAERARDARIRRWKEIQPDLPAMCRWINAKVEVQSSTDQQLGECPSHAAVAQRLTTSLDSLWREAEQLDIGNLAAFLQDLQPATAAVTWQMNFAGHQLRRRARASKAKAGGLDGWSGALMALLPLGFFDGLAEIWQHIVDGKGTIPQVWKQVRVAAIPKPDGGRRPLALTAMAWRLGASEILQQLRPWYAPLFPPELSGGLPRRSADSIHADLSGSLQARAARQSFVGCKADVRKCFDRVSPQAALLVLEWLGAPVWLTRTLASFYNGQERWVASAGVFPDRPVRGTASLLQGCPCSPLLLNGMMMAWILRVRRAEPTMHIGVFLDDRLLHTKGAGSVNRLARAASEGALADRALGFELHPAKLESFACAQARREELMEHADQLGIPQVDFVLLGVAYRLQGHQAFSANDVTRALRERGRRISRIAVSPQTRKRLAALLLLSRFRFRAPWTHFSKASVRNWAAQVEASVWGGPLATGRSPFLLWAGIGVDYHPEFVIIQAVLKREWRRLGRGDAAPAGPRVQAALRTLGWRVAGLRWHTPLGKFDTAEMTEHGFLERAREAWRRQLWARDKKTAADLATDQVPLLRPMRRLTGDNKLWALRVAAAAATDGRDLARLGAPTRCECGLPDPSRHHLTFECQRRPWTASLRTEQERRLLCAVVSDGGPPRPLRTDDTEAKIGELAEALLRHDETLTVATDGGAFQVGDHYGWRCASWAVALEDFVIAGRVPGEEQTAAAGERQAFRVLAVALTLTGRSARVLVDNQPLVQGFNRRAYVDHQGNELWDFWDAVHQARELLDVAWIPSHGKHKEWLPPLGWPSALCCRELNRRADTAATEQLNYCLPWRARLLQKVAEGEAWSGAALKAQYQATEGYHDKLKEVMRMRKMARQGR